jgi:DNA transformation protein and related proteins
MAASEGFIELLVDVLGGLGPVSVRRMFGGAGVYADGVMFGLVADDTLYLKADDATKGAFEAEGLGPYGYGGAGKRIDLPYWRIPERLLDDPDEMVAWARVALGVACRAKAAKPKKTKAKSKQKKAPKPAQKSRGRS